MSSISQTSQAIQPERNRTIQKIFHAPQSDLIRLGRRIGRGAEGEVYEIQDRDDLVAKIYHEPPPSLKAEKLLALSRLGNERLFNLSAWPVDVLRYGPDSAVAGFLMKKISQAEEVHALHSPKSRLQKFPEASWAFLIYVASNIARAVAAMHEHGFVIGDVNPKNILVTHKATVYLLDVDSFQISADDRTYRCEGGFPEYTPPELQGLAFREIDRTPEHDYFGMAVVIFQLLFMGRHPFSGRFLGTGEMPLERAIQEFRFAYGPNAEARQMRQPPGTLSLDAIPAPLRELFSRAFLTTDRPQPREWIETLDALSKSLKKCSIHSGHDYYQDLPECPWCGIEMKARVRLFNFLFPGAESQRGHFRLDEIWDGILKVDPPGTELIPEYDELKKIRLSADVAAATRKRRIDMALAIMFTSMLSFGIPWFTDIPISIVLLYLVALMARKYSGAAEFGSEFLQTISIFINRRKIPNSPLIDIVRLRRQEAEKVNLQLQNRYDIEAGNERWGAMRDELLTQKEAYENISEIRKLKLAEWETKIKKNQLNSYLDQFRIDEAKIKGINSTIKSSLLSHGIETAADVTNEVGRLLTLGRWRRDQLLEWRNDLERSFVFDPERDDLRQTRVTVEKEIDQLRFRIERELSVGAHTLERAKREIETNRVQLLPAVIKARREVAQAEKDWDAAIKHNTLKPILIALIIAFTAGNVVVMNWRDISHKVKTAEASHSEREKDRAADAEKAVMLYKLGEELSKVGNHEEAIEIYRQAISFNPRLRVAYEGIASSATLLKQYGDAAEAWRQAVFLEPGFHTHYNLGRFYHDVKYWEGAETDLTFAVFYVNQYNWEPRSAQAYDLLGENRAKLKTAQKKIKELKERLKIFPEQPVARFELATLYMWTGASRAGIEQYQILKKTNSNLAIDLKKLLEKHKIRLPADSQRPSPRNHVIRTRDIASLGSQVSFPAEVSPEGD